jgi:hypothetical protein
VLRAAIEYNAVTAVVPGEAIFGMEPALMWIMAGRTTTENVLQINAQFSLNVISRLDIARCSGI